MSRCTAHSRCEPCGQCTSELWRLLQARALGASRLWDVDLDGFTAVLRRGTPDLTACGVCRRGSAYGDKADKCTCKGGKLTPLRAAEQRCDEGAAWEGEDVTVDGRRLRGEDHSWQKGNPYGASKESLLVLNMIKAKTNG
jgi:hypothetical protein